MPRQLPRSEAACLDCLTADSLTRLSIADLLKAGLNSAAYVSAHALLFPVMHTGGDHNVGRLFAGDRCCSAVPYELGAERSLDSKLGIQA
jgi:hypothetical protein